MIRYRSPGVSLRCPQQSAATSVQSMSSWIRGNSCSQLS